MNITINISDERIERVAKSLMENCPESSISMQCEKWGYEKWDYRFRDYEDGKLYKLDKAKIIAAFALFYSDKYPKGLEKPPLDDTDAAWDDWELKTDADVTDALIQLACFGEVIYG